MCYVMLILGYGYVIATSSNVENCGFTKCVFLMSFSISNTPCISDLYNCCYISEYTCTVYNKLLSSSLQIK
ncbi:hypothetical protein AAZX31_20G032900 [Glycine max]|nr:hypothetical protein GLYMA_20G037150v4 [Glycine max]KAH1034403.1 hypothetical protein GYH30_054700 [Glycine max]